MADLASLKDEYEQERLFLIGNGPSLNQTPLEELDSEYTLAMNSITRIYSDTDWRPTFYCNFRPVNQRYTPDTDVIVQNFTEETTCFIYSEWEDRVPAAENVYYFDRWGLWGSPFHSLTAEEITDAPIEFLSEFWSDNVANFLYYYHSMYGAVQIAAFLGFDELYFVGCDLGFEYSNPHMIFEDGLDPHLFEGGEYAYLRDSIKQGTPVESLINAIAMKVIKKKNQNETFREIFTKAGSVLDRFVGQGMDELFDENYDDHFTDEYFDVEIMNRLHIEQETLNGHRATKRICEHKGIDIYNATLGGELDVYERVSLDSLL